MSVVSGGGNDPFDAASVHALVTFQLRCWRFESVACSDAASAAVERWRQRGVLLRLIPLLFGDVSAAQRAIDRLASEVTARCRRPVAHCRVDETI